MAQIVFEIFLNCTRKYTCLLKKRKHFNFKNCVGSILHLIERIDTYII